MTKTTRYEITIDLDSYDDDARETLASYARYANATFENITLADSNEPRFAYDATLRFDATPNDIARYVDTYDCADAITPID